MGNQACVCCEDLKQEDNQDAIKIQVIDPKLASSNRSSGIKDKNSREDYDIKHSSSPRFQTFGNDKSFSGNERQDVEGMPKSGIQKNDGSRIKNEGSAENLDDVELVQIPQLNQKVAANLKKYEPTKFHDPANHKLRRYQNLIYNGEVNERNQPHGQGTMYYPSGAVFVGQFVEGIAQGSAHYVLSDGSFYKGKIVNNKAQDKEGYYESENFKYEGGVKNNLFDGHGKQVGPTHRFEGIYEEGARYQGTFKWNDPELRKSLQDKDAADPLSRLSGEKQDEWKKKEGEYDFEYTGSFDSNGLFSGKGTLIEPKGTYRGQFDRGLKDGQGVFQFKTGLKFVGHYKNDQKQGDGTLYGKNGTVSYSGNFNRNMPDGKGYVLNKKGDKVMMMWRDGISSEIKQQDK